jgi:hypothetical protein
LYPEKVIELIVWASNMGVEKCGKGGEAVGGCGIKVAGAKRTIK